MRSVQKIKSSKVLIFIIRRYSIMDADSNSITDLDYIHAKRIDDIIVI